MRLTRILPPRLLLRDRRRQRRRGGGNECAPRPAVSLEHVQRQPVGEVREPAVRRLWRRLRVRPVHHAEVDGAPQQRRRADQPPGRAERRRRQRGRLPRLLPEREAGGEPGLHRRRLLRRLGRCEERHRAVRGGRVRGGRPDPRGDRLHEQGVSGCAGDPPGQACPAAEWLEPQTEYKWKVLARNGQNKNCRDEQNCNGATRTLGRFSDELTVTQPRATPAVPTDVAVVSATKNELALSWNMPAIHGSALLPTTGYRIAYASTPRRTTSTRGRQTS